MAQYNRQQSRTQRIKRQVVKRVQSRGVKRYGVNTADRYLSPLTACGVDGKCFSRHFSSLESGAFDSLQKSLRRTLIWDNPQQDVQTATIKNKSDGTGIAKGACMEFDCVMSTNSKDRDQDILDPLGCQLDPRCKLLWQHIPSEPIGRVVKELDRNEKMIVVKCAIVDSVFGRDVAQLVEFGALDISHGFDPFEVDSLKKGRLHITKYETYEVSLVSVPANREAVVMAYSKGKLKSPLVSQFAKGYYQNRKIRVPGWNAPEKPKIEQGGSKNMCGCTAKKAVKAKLAKGQKMPEMTDEQMVMAEALMAVAEDVQATDYGQLFYNPESGLVWFVVGDSHGADEANGDTPIEDIEAALTEAGAENVQIEAESMPPKGEGWVMLYPEVMAWEEPEGESEPDSDGDSAEESGGESPGDKADGDDSGDVDSESAGDGGEVDGDDSSDGSGTMSVDTMSYYGYLPGSYEHRRGLIYDSVRSVAAELAGEFDAARGDWVDVMGTYDKFVIVSVYTNADGGSERESYKVPYKIENDEAVMDVAAARAVAVNMSTEIIEKSFGDRVKLGVHIKAGATLNTKNRELLKEIAEDLDAIAAEDDGLKRTSKIALGKCSERIKSLLSQAEPAESDEKSLDWADLDDLIDKIGLEAKSQDIQNTVNKLKRLKRIQEIS